MMRHTFEKLFPITLGMAIFFLLGLTTYDDFLANQREQVFKVPARALVVKGSNDNELYYLEANPTTGALITEGATRVGSVSENIRSDHSITNVTTTGWVELVASTSSDIAEFYIFDSSGETLQLGTGVSGSESALFNIIPGGYSHPVEVNVPAGSRLAVRAVSNDATLGELTIVGVSF